MTFQTPKELKEPKETFEKVVSFWLKPSTLRRLNTRCSIDRLEKSEVLRLLVNLFLTDNDLENRVLEGLKNG